ncbi:type II toxin-antitoxin system Phd/YefM family antitoxin [uncultured Shewanella sp.]|uniref:type II toxin-antitoxin system Phd/YefM family antitoxin n=1 Tax=uncultured Shewanella sp. TaxID=173975 RepID=UPI0026312BA4|nr:type II toxin-antitoxin system Phd/YefM family antitoxin [uncultured Shewanella sp.]
MRTIRPILADNSTSISELKKNPMAVVEQADGFPVAVLNRNQPAFYCVPAEAYELMMDKLEDMELAQLVEARRDEPEIEVNIDDL